MQTSLRRMGNSTGLIVPKTLLAEIGLAAGATVDLRVEDGKLVAAPALTVREDRAAAAAEVAAAEES